jgi:hypothetical protein
MLDTREFNTLVGHSIINENNAIRRFCLWLFKATVGVSQLSPTRRVLLGVSWSLTTH